MSGRTPFAAQPGNTDGNLKRRADIQGLRALAVLLVVAFHAGLPLPGGFIGVDMFFVISGFVIAGMLLRELERTATVGFASFYTRRMRRLLPALALLSVVVTASSALLLSPFGPQQATAATSLAATLFSANLYLGRALDAGYFDLAAGTNALLHTWSLSVEEQFYLVFPAFLVVAWRLGARVTSRRSPRQVTTALVVGATAASFAISCSAAYGSTVSRALLGTRLAFYSPVARSWEFGVGVILALGTPALARLGPRVAAAFGMAGVVLVGIGAVSLSGATPFPGVAALLPVLGTGLILAAGTATRRGVTAILGMRPAVRVGDVSYGWYLWHWPLVVFAAAYWPGNRWVLVLAAVGSLVPTWLSYRFVETPIRFNDRLIGRRMMALAAVCVAVPAIGYLGVSLASRLEIRARKVEGFSVALRKHGEGLGPCGASIELGSGTPTGCAGSVSQPIATIVLVGDSNAGQFAEPVAEAAGRLGHRLAVASFGGCPFVDLVRESAPVAGFDGAACHRFVMESVAAMKRSPPALVIMATSSSQVVNDGSSLTDPASGEVATTPLAKARLFERGLASVLRQLAEARIPALVIHAVPHLGEAAQDWQAATCPALKIFAGSCGTSIGRAEVEQQQQQAREAERRAVAGVPGAFSADFTDDLCPAGRCASNQNGRWMYRDATHLSVEGALTLTGRFRQLIIDRARR